MPAELSVMCSFAEITLTPYFLSSYLAITLSYLFLENQSN